MAENEVVGFVREGAVVDFGILAQAKRVCNA